MSSFTNYLQRSVLPEVCCFGMLKNRFKSVAGVLTVMLFLLVSNTANAQCDGSEPACLPNYQQGIGNGPNPSGAKMYCSNSGAVETGLINCTTAADTDGCGIDASQEESMVSMFVEANQATKDLFGAPAQDGSFCPTKQYMQWIVFATPPTVKGTKIQAVGASDSWFLFHAGAFTDDQATADAHGIPLFDSVLDALSNNPTPALSGVIQASDMVTCSNQNQYKPWSNENAIIGANIYNIYYIGLSYDRPTNGSLNFKVKECEIGCEPTATCLVSDLDLTCEDTFPTASTTVGDIFNVTDNCGNPASISSSDSSVTINGNVRSITRTYTLTINGVTVATCPQTITITDTVLDITGNNTNVDCNGASTGAIDITINNGTPPYTYDWSNNAITEDLSNIAAGTYTVTVTDDNGCTGTYEATITEPSEALSLSAEITNVDCNGNSTGAVDLTVTGGTPDYTFSWNDGAYTTEDLSGVPAGFYTGVVTDANGCTAEATVEVTQPTALSLSAEITNVDCNGNSTGAVDLTVTGGTPDYTFSWNDGAYTTEDLSGVPAGFYTGVVTDANGCTAEATVEVTQPTALSLSAEITNVDCNGNSTGAVDLTVTGGTPDYTFSWNDGAYTTEDLSGVPAGFYTGVVTDANGCTAEATVEVTQPTALSLSAEITNVDCNGNSTGAVDLTVTGGTPDYTFSWNDGAYTTEDLSGVPAGFYTGVVTDANGCTAEATVEVTQPTALSLSAEITNVDCNGNSTGAVDLTVTGGTPDYTFSWNDGAYTTEDLSGVPAGFYTGVVTDANGCTAEATVEVTQPTALSLSAEITNVDCNGNSTGAVDLTVTGGTPDYTFSWNDGAYTTEDLSGVPAGFYTGVVTDANGCTAEATVEVTQPTALSLSAEITNVDCNGNSTGAVDLTVTGGTPDYTFSWNDGAYTTEDLSGVPAGFYTGVVTDANGCTAEATVEVTQPTALSASATGEAISCNGDTDGNIDLTVTGGTGPYTFDWDNGATTEDLSGLSAGTYTVTVTDANGCETTASAEITEPAPLTALGFCGDGVCYNGGVNSTRFGMLPEGGTPPYTYEWLPNGNFPGSTDQITDFENAPVGTTWVEGTVTDANGCTFTVHVDIVVFADPVVSIDPIEPICDDATEFMLSATSDADSVEWTSNGSASFDDATSLNPTITNFIDGEVFTLTATNVEANGKVSCSSSTDITISIIVCCEPAATCNLQAQSLDCKDINELADFAVEFPPFGSDEYASVFTDIETCGKETSMSYEDSGYNVQVNLNVSTVYTATRTYTLTIDGIEFTCEQLLTVTNAAPIINNGDDLVPGDIPNVDFEGCKPEGDINGQFSNDLIIDCFGNPVDSNNVLIEVITVTGDDCNWTLNIRTTVTTGNGGTIVIRDDSIDGGDKVAPVITVNDGVAPDLTDFDCVIPSAPTFSASDNCAEGLIPEVTTDGPTGEACARTQTWTANVSDGCNDAIPVSITYTWVDAPVVTFDVLPANDSVSACLYEAGDVAAWVALQEENLNLGGGCDPQLSSDFDPEAMIDACDDSITVTWTITDTCIDPIEASATFTITPAPAVTFDVLPANDSVSACLYEAGDVAAWVALQEENLNLGGGCDPQLSSDFDPEAMIDACDDSITVTWTITDTCIDPIEASATFTITPAPAVTFDVLPANDSVSACLYEAGDVAAWVALQEENLNLGGGCDPQLSSDFDPEAMIDACDDSITVTWTITDTCIDPIEASATFTITPAPAVTFDVLPANDSVSACLYEAGDVAAWVALQEENLNLGGGCDPQLSSDFDPEAMIDACDDSITVTWTITDTCIDPIEASATFTITPAPAVTFDVLPANDSVSACLYEAGDVAAWVALQEENLNLGGGCDPQLSSDFDPEAMIDACDDSITVTWTITDTCIDPIEASATFTITPAPAVTFDVLPANDSVSACLYEAGDVAAWVALQEENLNLGGGCDPQLSSDFDPEAMIDACDDSITVTWTITDTCIDPIEASATFTITPAPAVTFDVLPANDSVSACLYEAGDVAAWVALQEENLNLGGGCDPQLSSDFDPEAMIDACDDSITVTWTITDTCIDPIEASATFTITPAPAVTFDVLPANDSVSACLYEAGDVAAWVALQEENLNLGGGCDPQLSSDFDPEAMIDACDDSITVTWTITDTCIDPIEASATFTITPAPAVTFDVLPANDSVSACLYEAGDVAAWVALQEENLNLGGGCDPQLSSDFDPEAMIDACDDSITVTWTITDTCIDPIEASATFTITPAPAVTFDVLPANDSVSACLYEAGDVAAWVALQEENLNLGGGCDPQLSSDFDPEAMIDACDDSITVTWTITDTCIDPIEASATFTITPAPAVTFDVLPANDSVSACLYEAGDVAAWVALQEENLNLGGGCDPQLSSDFDPEAMIDACDDSITVTWTITDTCIDPIEASATFTITPAPAVTFDVLPANDSVSACLYEAGDVAAWVALQEENLNLGGGCDPQLSSDFDPEAMIDACDDSITVTWTITDTCIDPIEASATFTITPAPAVTFDVLPANDSVSACLYEAGDVAAWVALQEENLNLGGGCDPQLSSDFDPEAMIDACDDSITVTWTITDTCIDPIEASATFTITPAPAVTFDVLPANDSVSACLYEAGDVAAWVALQEENLNLGGGCDPQLSSDFDPEAMIDACDDSITVTWTITDTCIDPIEASATFTITPAPAVTFDVLPANDSVSACLYEAGDVAAWVALQEENLNLGGGCDPQLSSDFDPEAMIDACDDSITVTWTITDTCIDPIEASATFTITPAPAVTFDVLPANDSVSACLYEAGDVAAWVALQEENLNLGGGCDPQLSSDFDPEAMIDACDDSITVTWTITDTCIDPIEASATFTITPAPAVTFDVLPANDSVSACLYEAGDVAAWVALQEENLNLGGGCDPQLSSDFDPEAMIDACDDSITVTWTITDTCIDPIEASATFTITPAPAVTFDVLPANDSVSACLYEAGDVAAWVALQEENLNLGGGCDPQLSSDFDPEAMIDACDDSITVTWTITDTCIDPIEASATFTITPAPAVTFDVLPANDSVSACLYEAGDVAAWVALQEENLNLGGGCDPQLSSDFDPEAMIDACDDSITVTWTITDTCIDPIEASATFTITPAPAVDVDGPASVDASACDYADQADLEMAYQDWLNAFTVVEAGCGAQGSFTSTPPSVDLCSANGNEITLTYTAADGCTSDEITRTFKVSADMPPVLECPMPDEGSDSIFLGCNPEDLNGDKIPDAVVTSVNYMDDCDGNGQTSTYTDGDGVTFDSEACEYSLTRTFSYTDRCGRTAECSVTYTWKIPEGNETAFAFFNDDDKPNEADADSQCFITDPNPDYDFNRWGWTNTVDFSEVTSYEMDIYAGAGQCDLSKGTDVGSVFMTYDAINSTVTFEYDLDGYAMNEAHIYIGCDPYPSLGNGKPTVAPGQYTYVDGGFGNVTNYKVEIPVTGTQFNVIVHAVTTRANCTCLSADVDTTYGGSAIEGCDANSGIQSLGRTLQFSVAPVPFKENVTVKYQFDYETDVTIEVYDMKGALVSKTTDTNYVKGRTGRSTINTSRLQDGMYLVNLTTNQGSMNKKIVSGN